MIANTPVPPYYVVIFTSLKNEQDNGYSETAKRMEELARHSEGFLGAESARNEIGITVSYWRDLESVRKWKMHAEHMEAQTKGKQIWYRKYKVRICKVEREYGFEM